MNPITLNIKNYSRTVTLLLASLMLMYVGAAFAQDKAHQNAPNSNKPTQTDTRKAIFAGGCFWCIEADFEKLKGVTNVISGYTGGAADTANYKTVSYTETGHYEAVEVSYKPQLISYSELVDYFWRHIDPTNPNGQFCDSGSSYRSAIFYGSDEEQMIVEQSLAALEKNKSFDAPIVTVLSQVKPFYPAEDYHQDYYKKNPIRYKLYRTRCGRDRRVAELWGKDSK